MPGRSGRGARAGRSSESGCDDWSVLEDAVARTAPGSSGSSGARPRRGPAGANCCRRCPGAAAGRARAAAARRRGLEEQLPGAFQGLAVRAPALGARLGAGHVQAARGPLPCSGSTRGWPLARATTRRRGCASSGWWSSRRGSRAAPRHLRIGSSTPGCGSGILALSACLLGFRRRLGIRQRPGGGPREHRERPPQRPGGAGPVLQWPALPAGFGGARAGASWSRTSRRTSSSATPPPLPRRLPPGASLR